MDPNTIEQLLALNRQFYTTLAAPFAASRPASDPVLLPILPHIPESARVLDVGCGNGRLALLLARERPGVRYVGVDIVPKLLAEAQRQVSSLAHEQPGAGDVGGNASPQLLAEARHQTAPKPSIPTFYLADVAQPGWTGLLPAGTFDCAVILAVLHHLPSFDLRARVLGDIGAVLKPAGRIILSTWQFLTHERMRRKIVPWAAVDIDEEQLEPGDYLLDWKRGGRGLRYCHLIDEAELQQLATASGFRVLEMFRAGGREGNLSLGAVLG